MKDAQSNTYFPDPIKIDTFTDLFYLYGDLVTPMREYENVADCKFDAQCKLEQAQKTIATAFITPLVQAISRTVLFALPWMVFFLILCNIKQNAEGVKWITLYDEWYSSFGMIEQAKAFLASDSIPMWLGTALTYLHYIVIQNLIMPVFFFLLPLMLVLSALTTAIAVLRAKRTIQEKRKAIDELDAELSERLADLSKPICLVPPDYRFSDAIEFFYRCFINGKAGTIKEAVLQYDKHLHYRRMEQQGQQEVVPVANNDLLRNLEYPTLQIATLSGKVELAK